MITAVGHELALSTSFAAVGHRFALSNSSGAFRFQLLRFSGWSAPLFRPFSVQKIDKNSTWFLIDLGSFGGRFGSLFGTQVGPKSA